MIKLYEIVKVYNTYPLFFEDHISRLHTSIQLAFHRDDSVLHLFSEIIPKIKSISPIPPDMNLRIDYISGKAELSLQPLILPSAKMYKEGAKTALFRAERPHPNLKEENKALRRETNKIMEEKGYYEVFLQKQSGFITEGSRSNFFLIQNNTLISSPEQTILRGITRQKVLDICLRKNIPIMCKEIEEQDFKTAEALILTGTSPEILAVKSCNGYTFKVDHPVISLLKEEFRVEKERNSEKTMKLFMDYK